MKPSLTNNANGILWISLSGLCLLVSFAGSAYAFGIFSPLLSKNLGYTAKTLDVIASIANIGSIFVGFGIDVYGIHAVVKFGGCLIFIGLTYIWLAIEQLIPTNPLFIGFFYFLVQTGSCCFIASAVTAAIMVFPEEGKGTAIGLVKGYFALSTAVLANLSVGFFSGSPSMFVLFIAILIPITGLFGVSLVVIPNIPYTNNTSATGIWFVRHWICLFVTLFVVSTLMYTIHDDWLHPFSATVILLLLLSLSMIPYLLYPTSVLYTGTDKTTTEEEEGNPLLDETSITLYSSVSLQDIVHFKPNLDPTFKQVEIKRSIPFKEAVYTWQMWALCYILFSLSGAGLMVIYNVIAIGTAVGLTPSAYFISLTALSNGFGRVIAGLVADHIGKYIPLLPITPLHLLAIVAANMAIIQGILSMGIQATILPGLLMVSFYYGCTASLISVNITDIFGPEYVATNLGFIETSPILGGFIFASLVVNGFYSDNTINNEGNLICQGRNCFEMAFIISSIACIIAAVIAIYI